MRHPNIAIHIWNSFQMLYNAHMKDVFPVVWPGLFSINVSMRLLSSLLLSEGLLEHSTSSRSKFPLLNLANYLQAITISINSTHHFLCFYLFFFSFPEMQKYQITKENKIFSSIFTSNITIHKKKNYIKRHIEMATFKICNKFQSHVQMLPIQKC